MPNQPLAEVFGFPVDNMSDEAIRFRTNRLCPFNNKIPNCTKDKAEDPLGTCSVFSGANVAVTCPVRFREAWKVTGDAASFFFPPEARWTSLTEIRLEDGNGQSAGNIDVVLVALDDDNKIYDFGAIEVQAVYISGNVRNPFTYYMEDPPNRQNFDWRRQRNYPRPDFLSSSRKRLAPQLIYKGGILHEWRKKIAVALDRSFLATLPPLPQCPKNEAEIAWLIYDPILNVHTNRYELTWQQTLYTKFEPSLLTITRTNAGAESDFVAKLQEKLNGVQPVTPPVNRLLFEEYETEE